MFSKKYDSSTSCTKAARLPSSPRVLSISIRLDIQHHNIFVLHLICNILTKHHEDDIETNVMRNRSITSDTLFAMESPKTPMSLISLPTEILLQILEDMTYSDIQAIRHTSRHFSAALPKPSNVRLVEAKDSAKLLGQTLIACDGCLRLLPHVRFSTKMLIWRKSRATIPFNTVESETRSSRTNLSGSITAASGSPYRNREQFCNKCGSRPLPGLYRYQRGDVWDIEKGLWFLRCQRCGLCEQTSGRPLDEKTRRQREGELCRRCFKLENKRSPSKQRCYPSPPKEAPLSPVPSMGGAIAE